MPNNRNQSVSLEFAIQYPCPLRARHSEEQLRRWGRLSNLHTKLTTGDTSVPSEDKLKWVEDARDEVELMQTETTICPNLSRLSATGNCRRRRSSRLSRADHLPHRSAV